MFKNNAVETNGFSSILLRTVVQPVVLATVCLEMLLGNINFVNEAETSGATSLPNIMMINIFVLQHYCDTVVKNL